MNHVIHYHLPSKEDEFTHRNGRTARMLSTGTAYIIAHESEKNGIHQLWNGSFKLKVLHYRNLRVFKPFT
jgi:superfamily II DNA/RNA helicase